MMLGKLRWSGVVLAVLAPAGADVEALVELREQLGDVGGIVLQVAIHRDDDLAGGEIEAGHHRGGLAEIAAEMDDFHARDSRRRGASSDGLAAVVAAVIDENQLPRPADRSHNLGDAPVEGREGLRFIIDWDGDRDHADAGSRH